MNGVLVIDKPVGPTSHDVVAKVRKLLKEKAIGHTGTLDPAATGVLPLVVGGATKIARFLTGGDKTYDAVIALGTTTTTLDGEGEVLETKPVTCTPAEVEVALKSFVGPIEQVPPMYSAKKIDGKRLYELARKGVEVEREAKKVTIYTLDVRRVELPLVELSVCCSAGTYVRVLAQDLGVKLGCGGHLKQLRRTVAGPFSLADAVTLEALATDPALAESRALPVSRALAHLPRITIPEHLGKMVASGYQLTAGDLKTLDVPEFAVDAELVLWLDRGEVLAVAKSLMPSGEIESSRRERRAFETERVLLDLRK